MDLEDLMNHWYSKADFEETRLDGEQDGLDNISPSEQQGPQDEGIEEVPGASFGAYRDFLSNLDAWQWLVSRLRREFHLVPGEPNTMRIIRQEIVSSLPTPHRVSKSRPSETYYALLQLDWDPLTFFGKQRYTMNPAEALDGVVTLTGSCLDAQAATCREYVNQTWPLTGEIIMELVKKVLDDPSNPDGTNTCQSPHVSSSRVCTLS